MREVRGVSKAGDPRVLETVLPGDEILEVPLTVQRKPGRIAGEAQGRSAPSMLLPPPPNTLNTTSTPLKHPRHSLNNV